MLTLLALVASCAALAAPTSPTPATADLVEAALASAVAQPVDKASCTNVSSVQEACCAHISSSKIVRFDDHICLNATLGIGPGHNLTDSTVTIELGNNGKDVYKKTFELDKLQRECTIIKIHGVPVDLCAEFDKGARAAAGPLRTMDHDPAPRSPACAALSRARASQST